MAQGYTFALAACEMDTSTTTAKYHATDATKHCAGQRNIYKSSAGNEDPNLCAPGDHAVRPFGTAPVVMWAPCPGKRGDTPLSDGGNTGCHRDTQQPRDLDGASGETS
jgi:hypothetical protein